jgi:hypothetical protein
MKFNKLPKQKRQQLIALAVITLAVLGGLAYGPIRSQYQSLHRLAALKATSQGKLLQIQNTVKRSEQLEADLVTANAALADAESDTLSGDLYASIITTLRRFKANYRVDIPRFSPISAESEVPLFPNFPYKQATMTIGGTATFHDFGRFLADFEDEFPHARIVNLTLDPNSSAAPEQKETIVFKMDIVTLVKSNAS